MKYLTVCFAVLALAFLSGLAMTRLLSFDAKSSELSVEEPVIFVDKAKAVDPLDPDEVFRLPDDYPPLATGEFFLVGHACGNGYTDGYLAYDGSRLNAGLAISIRSKFEKEVRSAEKLISREENFKNKNVKRGTRVVLQQLSEKRGEYSEILIFDGHDNLYYVKGPSLSITLELEKWLDKIH